MDRKADVGEIAPVGWSERDERLAVESMVNLPDRPPGLTPRSSEILAGVGGSGGALRSIKGVSRIW